MSVLMTSRARSDEAAGGELRSSDRAEKSRKSASGVATRIRRARYEKGWGPSVLADLAQISRTALFQIESGRTRRPRAVTLARIAQALGLELTDLVGPATTQESPTASPPPSEAVGSDAVLEQDPLSDASHHRELLGKVEELLRSPYAEWVSQSVEMVHHLLRQNRRLDSCVSGPQVDEGCGRGATEA